MNIEDFLSRLECVTPNGEGRWMARCPAHPDGNPSMSVAIGDKGGILVKCFAGCTAEEIVSAMGLKMGDLMPDDGKRKPARAGKRRPKDIAKAAYMAKKEVDAYVSKLKASDEVLPASAEHGKRRPSKHVRYHYYTDADGNNVYRVDRREFTDEKGGKTFLQQHPDPDASYGWSYGVARAGVTRVPYRLPKLLDAANNGRFVIVCEGEKDVESIETLLGYTATTNAGGGMMCLGEEKRWGVGWGKYFKGVPKVLIIADRDPDVKANPVTGEVKPFLKGQRHACIVERMLRADGYKGVIRKICMPAVKDPSGFDRPVKDFTEWAEALVANGLKVDRSAFQHAIQDAGEWPDEWNFSDADLADLPRAQKNARDTTSPSPVQEVRRPQTGNGRAEIGEAGRYGRPSPRAPFSEKGCYQVDFQMSEGEIARFNVGVGSIQFEGWRRSESAENFGEFVRMADYPESNDPPYRMVGNAVDMLDRFHKGYKLGNPQRTELTCSIMLAWLRARGKFFADADNPMYGTSLYFDRVSGVLYNIQSDEFQSFLSTESNVSRKNKVFEFMMALIEDMTMTSEETPRVRPSKEWDRKGDVLYVSNGDSRLFRISANKIEDMPNGTDGVVFLRGATLKPFKLVDGPGVDPFVGSMLFRYAALEKPVDVMNCKLWTLNLFACHTNKPILLVNGPRGSGKTFLLQGIKQFLGIRTDGQIDDTVNKMDHSDKGSQDFWIIIDKGRFEIFDNFDYKIKWADNDLQTASTNGSHKTRELYKTNILITQFARACIALTSNNAVFASEGGGLPDRIITAKTIGRPKVPKGPGELLADNMDNRDKYLTYIMRVLASAMADEKPVDSSINMRHPEYAEFSVRCGRAMGCEDDVIRALSTAEIEKAVLPLVNDIIAKEVIAVLVSQKAPGNLSFTAGEMSDMIISRFGDETDEKTKTIYGSRRVGKTFQRFNEDFKTIFKWSTRTLDGKTRYDFAGLTPRGETVLDSLKSGLVGFDTQISENPTERTGAGSLSENDPLNPLNPLHARADIQDSLCAREVVSKDITDSSSTDEGDSLDDLDF